MTNGLVQHIWVEESTSLQWVNILLFCTEEENYLLKEVLTFSLAGLEVVSHSAFISYVLQVQVLLRSCQTNLISSCYILPFPLLHYLAQTEPFRRQYTTRLNGSSKRIRMDKSTGHGQKGAKTPNQDLFSEDIWLQVEVYICNFMKSSSVIFMFSCLVSECQLLFLY